MTDEEISAAKKLWEAGNLIKSGTLEATDVGDGFRIFIEKDPDGAQRLVLANNQWMRKHGGYNSGGTR